MRSDLYTTSHLPPGNDVVLQDGQWDEHPTEEGILFHHSGNYVYDEKTENFLRIVVRTYKKSGYQDVHVCIRRKKRHMNHVALEAFDGVLMQKKEQSDHLNHIRTDNSKGNLRRCFSLFNNRNRRPFSVSPVTGIQGVIYRHAEERFIARVRMMIPGERQISKSKSTSWSVKKYGYDKALRLAKEWRQRFG